MASTIISAQYSEYKDLDLRFKAHPLYGDVRPVKDDEAIKNSIRNIILTRRGEKPFNPDFGCGMEAYLFEPADAITKLKIGREIEFSISRLEPRVKLTEIRVVDNPDNNAYNITVVGSIVNSQREINLDLMIKRLR